MKQAEWTISSRVMVGVILVNFALWVCIALAVGWWIS